MSRQKLVTPLSFFEFMANLEQSKSQIRDAWSVVHNTALMLLLWIKLISLTKNADFFQKKC